MTPQQRYGLGSAPATQGGLSQKRKTKAITVSGKPKKFADGGKVEAEFDQDANDMQNADLEDMARRDGEARRRAAFAGAKKAEFEGGGSKVPSETTRRNNEPAPKVDQIHRTVNGAPIRNPRPANIPTVSGVVRG